MDRDGDVDISDATEVLTYYAQYGASLNPIFGKSQEEHEEIFPYADVDADGIITIADATLILTYYARTGASLPGGWDAILNK